MRVNKWRKRRGPVRNRRNKAGETLTETLVAMLIVGLSSVLFLTMVAASGRIFRRAEEEYKKIYGIISEADVQDPENETITDMITVKGDSSTRVTVAVKWYGDPDYVLSYKAE